ncbi:MAG: metallophosphoesterase family protein, partial [Clostridia bacterium]|nr:metallophosphoesterase family protein [Clostridia bacterium]
MTRVLVFSDTHGDLQRLDAAMARAGEADAFLHLGDFGADAQRIAERRPMPYHAVCGN